MISGEGALQAPKSVIVTRNSAPHLFRAHPGLHTCLFGHARSRPRSKTLSSDCDAKKNSTVADCVSCRSRHPRVSPVQLLCSCELTASSPALSADAWMRDMTINSKSSTQFGCQQGAAPACARLTSLKHGFRDCDLALACLVGPRTNRGGLKVNRAPHAWSRAGRAGSKAAVLQPHAAVVVRPPAHKSPLPSPLVPSPTTSTRSYALLTGWSGGERKGRERRW